MKKIYLAGGIFGVADPSSWREEATKLFGNGYKILDPTKFELDISYYRTLVETDLNEIFNSNAILAKVDNPSWGTAMELLYAYGLRKPVIGWFYGEFQTQRNPWLNYCVTRFASGLQSAVETTKDLLK